MKIFFILFLVVSSLFSSNSFFNEDKELLELNKKFPNDVIIKKYKEFLHDTGLNNNDLLSKVDRKDKDWLLGMNYFFNHKKDININYMSGFTYDKKTISTKLPLYEKSLEHFFKSSKKGNELSAYMGANIVVKYLLRLDSKAGYMDSGLRNLINNYFPTFLNVLVKNKYCFGYVFAVTYQESNLVQKNDILKYKLIKDGIQYCSSKNPEYMKRILINKKKHIDAIRKQGNKK